MSNITDNFFAIEEAESYRCTVWRYQIGHSVMLVRVYLPDEFSEEATTYYLLFENVFYFEGPIRWQSANFRVGDKEELADIMDRIGVTKSEEFRTDAGALDAFLTHYLQLYKVLTPYSEVRIVASGALKFAYQDARPEWHGSTWGYRPSNEEKLDEYE